jgi:hypothetical protein
MKRKQFIAYLNQNNCVLKREGSNHSVFINTKTGIKTTLPRHAELEDRLCDIICKQLGIPKIKNESKK